MRNATIKSLFAHKLRLALTALSIVLGVSFVSGTLVLGDTINHTFDVLFKDAYAGTDVQVRSQQAFQGSNDGSSSDVRNPVPQDLAATVAKVAGVKSAEGSLMGFAQIVDKHGKAIAPQAPTFGSSYTSNPALTPTRIKSGRAPTGPHDVVIDRGTADKYGFHVGD